MGYELSPGISPSREPPAAAYNKYPREDPRPLRFCSLATEGNILQRTSALVHEPACVCGVGHWTNYQPLKPLSISTGASLYRLFCSHTHTRLKNEFNVITFFFSPKLRDFFFKEQICYLFWTVPEAEKSGLGLASLSLLIWTGECGKARKEVEMVSPWLRASPGLSVSEGLQHRHQNCSWAELAPEELDGSLSAGVGGSRPQGSPG